VIRPTRQSVITRAADQIVAPGCAGQPVISFATIELVPAIAANQLVSARAASDLIMVRPAFEQIIPLTARQGIPACAANKLVIACTTAELILTIATSQSVVAAQPQQGIVARSTADLIIGGTAQQGVRSTAPPDVHRNTLCNLIERGQLGQRVGCTVKHAFFRTRGGLYIRKVGVEHRDSAKRILIMRAVRVRSRAALIAGERDDRIISRAIAISLHLRIGQSDGMRLNPDVVAIGGVEVGDDVVAKALDPMIVGVVILPGHAAPVDHAVGIGVLGRDGHAGINITTKEKQVRAVTAGQNIIRICGQVIAMRTPLRTFVALKDTAGGNTLCGCWFASVRARFKAVIACSANQCVAAPERVQAIITASAVNAIILGAVK